MKYKFIIIITFLATVNFVNAQWCAELKEYQAIRASIKNNGDKASTYNNIIEYYKERCNCENGLVTDTGKWVEKVNKLVRVNETNIAYLNVNVAKLEKVTTCKSSYNHDYYFANHFNCSEPVTFVINETNRSYSMKAGEELKISIPYNSVQLKIDVPCRDRFMTKSIKPEGYIFYGEPKTSDHILDRFYFAENGSDYLSKNKKDYEVKLLNETYDTQDVYISGKKVSLIRDKRYYFRKSLYFKPIIYIREKREKFILNDGDYVRHKNTRNGSDWFVN